MGEMKGTENRIECRERHSVGKYCLGYDRSDLTPESYARHMLACRRELCEAVMEVIGSWPSSEPELMALQRAFP